MVNHSSNTHRAIQQFTEIITITRSSGNDTQKFYVNQPACSAECQKLSEEEEEFLHPSTLMADPSEPHESTASAEYDDFESAYTARVNELESFLRSVEESEEHDSKQTKVAPSGSDNTVG